MTNSQRKEGSGMVRRLQEDGFRIVRCYSLDGVYHTLFSGVEWVVFGKMHRVENAARKAYLQTLLHIFRMLEGCWEICSFRVFTGELNDFVTQKRKHTMNPRITRLLAALCAFVTLPVLAQSIATVNGKAIPASRANAIVKQLVAHGQKDTPELRGMIKNELVMREILLQEASRKSISNSADVKIQLENARETIIINALRADFVKKHPSKDSEIQAEYDQYKKLVGDTDYHVRHILVPTEAEAKEVIAKLKDGGSFEDLAKEKSKDTGSAQKGGDIDWGNPGKYVKPFSDAMVKLSKGQYTETPVKTDFGYHVIKLEDTRPSKFPALEDIKPQVAKAVSERKWKEYYDGLLKKAKVK